MKRYSEIIEDRKSHEQDLLNYSLENIARSIVGKNPNDYKDEKHRAISQILKYFNVKERQLPKQYSDVEDILDYQLSTSGVMYRQVKLEHGWQNEAIGTYLGTVKDTHQEIALFPSHRGKYEYFDPDTGKRKKVTNSFAKKLDKDAICFYRPLPQRPITTIDLMAFLKECITVWDVTSYFLALCAVTLLGIFLPKINYIITGPVVDYGSYQLLLAIMLFAVFFLISSSLANTVKQLLLNRIQYKMSENIRAATMMRLLSLPASFFKDYTSGELNQYLDYMNTLCSTLVSTVISSSLTGVFSIVYIIQILNYAPSLVVPAIIISSLTVIVSLVSTKVQIQISKQKMQVVAKERGLVFSLLKGIQKIKVSGSENRAFTKWANLYAQEAKLNFSPPAIIAYNSVITAAISMIGTIVMYWIAVSNNVSVADYYAFNAAYAYVASAFLSVSTIAATLGTIKPVTDLIKPIMDCDVEVDDSKEPVSSIRGGVEFSHVTFQYFDNSPVIVNDISFSIKQNEYVAIVGETGCGKSTLIRLLLGFEEPSKGSIFYDKKDIKRLNLPMLRRNIGVVTQDDRLFEGSIYDNIVLTKPSMSLEDAWEAAEAAGIAEDIRKMPMGMHTRVLDSVDGGFSGGQRQRLLIARALAPKPKLLIFDEATSALDNLVQKQVTQSIDNLNCTRIVIAHRISTIINCDRILVMNDGKIAEEGNYQELLEKKGIFSELIKTQLI